jgi:hypothetical protein
VHDEFRVKVRAADPRAVVAALYGHEVDQDAQETLGRLVVTHEDDHVFIYADALSAAQRARQAVEDLLARDSLQGEVTLWRWHPEEERWEDASLPLPSNEVERVAEHAVRERRETEESLQSGHAEWEVRITLPTHHDARAFGERLRAEGIPVAQRWRHLLVGASDEDDARALAERLRTEAPQGSELEAQASGLPFWQMLHAPAQPFAFFGGLAQ